MCRRLATGFLALVVCLALSGCLLVSGEQASTSISEAGGNVGVSFVSAEGEGERSVDLGAPGSLQIYAVVSVGTGDLRLDVLNPDGEVAFSVAGSPDQQIARSGEARTDERGILRYRVNAREARNGSYQLLFERQ